MFIVRDELTQVDGVEAAKKKTIKLAMSSSEFLESYEMENMISGLLGCSPIKRL